MNVPFFLSSLSAVGRIRIYLKFFCATYLLEAWNRLAIAKMHVEDSTE